MIWLTWRQFRGQALFALGTLAALAIYLVILGVRLRTAYDVNIGCDGCSPQIGAQKLKESFSGNLLIMGLLLVLLPAVVGVFWGAPLIARELETGTHRLVWNQSVTRTRWLAIKLGFVTLAGVLFTGALSLLFTWAASPYDRVFNDRFDPISFPTRNLAPLGYAVFAVVAGTTIGLIARRTVIAMAVTLAAFAAMQILMPTVIRAHLRPAVTESVAFVAANTHDMGLNRKGEVSVPGYDFPGAWVLTTNPILVDADGTLPPREATKACFEGEPEGAATCLEAMRLHTELTYQPADRYWLFQWLEFGIYLLLAGLFAGVAFWRIPRWA